MNIYVGNIPYTVTEDDLRQAFEEFGPVTSSSIIIDKETGRSRGFGFVQMENAEDGARAIEEMNGKDWMGRVLTVNEARPRDERPGGFAPRRDFDGPRRSYGGGGGGYSGGGGGGYSGGGGYGGGSGGGGGRGGDRGRGGGGDRWGDRDRGGRGGGGRGRGEDSEWEDNRWNRGEDEY